MEEKLLTIEEVAQYLDVSPEEVKGLVDRGDLPAFKIGGVLLRFKREHVDNYRRRQLSSAITQNTLYGETAATGHLARPDFGRRDRWVSRKETPRIGGSTPYTFWERLEDFLYYNDFYIISLIILVLLAIAAFQF